jgi:hypothetical protein
MLLTFFFDPAYSNCLCTQYVGTKMRINCRSGEEAYVCVWLVGLIRDDPGWLSTIYSPTLYLLRLCRLIVPIPYIIYLYLSIYRPLYPPITVSTTVSTTVSAAAMLCHGVGHPAGGAQGVVRVVDESADLALPLLLGRGVRPLRLRLR